MEEFMKVRYNLLTPNPYSRPQTSLEDKVAIVIHYTANPMSNDMQNRNYFNNRKYGEDGYGSAHSIIDLDGSIVICIPPDEMAYAVGATSYMDGIQDFLGHVYPNAVTYNIEFTHPDWTGKPNKKTYDALVLRLAQLCIEWDIEPKTHILRHYDITGKNCPKFYVENEYEFIKLKKEVADEVAYRTQMYEDWQLAYGEDAIKELADEGIINSPEQHIENLNKGWVEPWLFWLVSNKIYKNLNNKIEKLEE